MLISKTPNKSELIMIFNVFFSENLLIAKMGRTELGASQSQVHNNNGSTSGSVKFLCLLIAELKYALHSYVTSLNVNLVQSSKVWYVLLLYKGVVMTR